MKSPPLHHKESNQTIYGQEEFRITTVIGKQNSGVPADSESEQHILRDSDDGHIHKTTEVTIERN